MGNAIWKWIGSTARLTKVKRLKIRGSVVFPGSAIHIGSAEPPSLENSFLAKHLELP